MSRTHLASRGIISAYCAIADEKATRRRAPVARTVCRIQRVIDPDRYHGTVSGSPVSSPGIARSAHSGRASPTR